MKSIYFISGILFLALILSLSYSFYQNLDPITDAAAYDKIGWNLAQGFGYIQEVENLDNPQEDDAIVRVGPGYEFALAAIYKVFGHSISIVWIFHAIFHTLSTLLVFLIAKKLFANYEKKEIIGILAAFLFALSPDLILISSMLLTETIFVTFILASTYLSLRFIEEPSYLTALLTSLSWGYSALIRPTALLAVFLLIILTFLKIEKKYVLVLLLFPTFFVGGWSLRNSLLFETPVFTTTAGGYNLWVGNNLEAKGGFDKTPEIQEARNRLHSVELSKLGTKKYFEFIFSHPIAFTELQIRKTAIYFSLIRPTGFWGYLKEKPKEQILTLLSSGFWTAGLFVLGIAGGLYVFFNKKELKEKLFLGIAILQPLAVIPLIVETRYRYALFPFLAILSSFALIYLIRNFDDKKMSKAFFWSIVAVTLLTLYDTFHNFGELISRTTTIF